MDERGELPGGDDPIRRLRQEYSERARIEQRRDKIETWVLAVFVWVFVSFWSFGIYAWVSGEWHGNTRTTPGPIEVEVLGAASFGLLVTVVSFPTLKRIVPQGEPGLLAWWDEWRRRR